MGLKPFHNPEEAAALLVDDLKSTLGGDLLAVCLYGSAAGPRYAPGKSDLNLLLLLGEDSHRRLKDLMPFCHKWAPARVGTPLVLTPRFLAESLDVFPIEYLVMAAEHRCLWGADPLAGLALDPLKIRLQLERELRGKLMALRTGLLKTMGRQEALLDLAQQALPAFRALFQAYLFLDNGAFPLQASQVMETLQAKGVRAAAFLALTQTRRGEAKTGRLMDLWEQALAELEQLIHLVDAWQDKQGACS